jgi:hypothetical protein
VNRIHFAVTHSHNRVAAIRRTAAEPRQWVGVVVRNHMEIAMARKYSRSASKDVKREVRKYKKGKLKSGRSGKTVKSRKQAIAIGLSEARKKGKKVPKKSTGRKTGRKPSTRRKSLR